MILNAIPLLHCTIILKRGTSWRVASKFVLLRMRLARNLIILILRNFLHDILNFTRVCDLLVVRVVCQILSIRFIQFAWRGEHGRMRHINWLDLHVALPARGLLLVLFWQSFAKLLRLDAGFDPRRIWILI